MKVLPISPIKQHDWEPVKTIDVDGKTAIVSRFHYDILIYANKPKLDDGKPVIDFSLGSHTPTVYSENDACLKSHIKKGAGASGFQIQRFKILFVMYERFLHKNTDKLCETKSYKPKKMDVRDDIKLDPTRAKAVIVVGETPPESHLERIGYFT